MKDFYVELDSGTGSQIQELKEKHSQILLEGLTASTNERSR